MKGEKKYIFHAFYIPYSFTYTIKTFEEIDDIHKASLVCLFVSLLFADLLWFEMPEADPLETQFIYIPKKLFLLRIAPTNSPWF